MCDCCTNSERSSDHCSLNDLSISCTGLARVAAVDVDAIRALRGERNGDRDQFLIFDWNSPFSDGRLIKGPKGFHHLRCKTVHAFQLG